MIIERLFTTFQKSDIAFVVKNGYFKALRMVRDHAKKHKVPFIHDTYQLANVLCIPRRELFAIARHPEQHYHPLLLHKRSGGYRQLHAPDATMKHLQRQILRRILRLIPISPYATAYVDGKGLVDNAAPHVGHKYLLKMDITDFFSSITFRQVLTAAFPSTVYPPQIGGMITTLCCYDEVLPQGAPTSPALSNIVMRHFDDAIGGWCRKRGITYTRYCDDLTFSADVPLYHVYQKVTTRLEELGFLVNRRKTHFITSASRQTVTGLTINDKVSIPSDYKHKLRQEVYYAVKFGIADSILHGNKEFVKRGVPCVTSYYNHLMGKLYYVLQIEPHNAWARNALEDLNLQFHCEPH